MTIAKKLVAVGCLILAGSGYANAVFPVGNFTVYGAVKTWGKDLFRAKDGVTVKAVSTNNTVLASVTLHDPISCDNPKFGDVYNYLLKVPMSTTMSDRAVTDGEPISLIIVSDTSTYTTTDERLIVATGAGEKKLINIELATDDDGDGVADQYVAELAVNMYAYGYEKYSKTDDWDGDGKSNYEEYLAGTDPFDETDKFTLTYFSAHGADGPVGNYVWPVAFYAKSGRVYSVVGVGSLETNALGQVGWTNETFAVRGSIVSSYTATEDDSPLGDGTTIWLMPVGDKHFWKVLIQDQSQGVNIKKFGGK